MPTYEYECKKCGHVFERFQQMSEKPLDRCPECSGKVVRLPGAGAGIIFKGSGFYATDYRSEDHRRSEKAEKRGDAQGGPKECKKPAKESRPKDEGRKREAEKREGKRSDTDP